MSVRELLGPPKPLSPAKKVQLKLASARGPSRVTGPQKKPSEQNTDSSCQRASYHRGLGNGSFRTDVIFVEEKRIEDS